MELVYRGPDGREVVAPAESFVRERLVDGELSYWEGPAGDAVLFRQGGGEDASVTLLVAAEGVILHFCDFMRREDVVLAHDPGADAGRVAVYDSQEWWSVSRRFLVPRELAWTVTAEFMRTGHRPPGLTWSRSADFIHIQP